MRSAAGAFLTLLGAAGLPPHGGMAQPAPAPERRGIVVEQVDASGGVARGGCRAGDLLLSWQRPSPTASAPGRVSGQLASVFDWLWMQMEEAPRGLVRVTAERRGKARSCTLGPEGRGLRVRPWLPPAALARYGASLSLLRKGALERGVASLRELAAGVEGQGAGRGLRCWLYFRIGQAWSEAYRWQEAQEAFDVALAAAPDELARVAVLRASGDAYHRQGELARAIEIYSRAAAIWRANWAEGLGFAEFQHRLAHVSYDQGELDRGNDYESTARALRQRLAPESIETAASLDLAGLFAYARGHLTAGLDACTRALAMRERQLGAGNLEVMESLNHLAQLLTPFDQQTRITQYLQRAAVIARRLPPSSLDRLPLLVSQARFALYRGEADRARRHLEAALAIGEKAAPGGLDTVRVLNSLGSALGDRDPELAERYLLRAGEILNREAPGGLDEAIRLNNLGAVALRRSDWALAERLLTSSLAIEERWAQGSPNNATIYGNLGLLASDRGDLETAKLDFDRSLQIVEDQGLAELSVATALEGLAAVYDQRGDLDIAERYLRRALAIYRSNGMAVSEDVKDLLISLSQIARARKNLAAAERYGAAGLRLGQRLAPGLGLAGDLGIMGELATERGEFGLAEWRLTRGLALALRLAPRSLDVAELLYARGVLESERGRLQSAERYLKRALELEESLTPGTAEEAETLRQLGRVFHRRGLLSRATQSYLRALAEVEHQAGRLGGALDSRVMFRAQYWDFFRELVELLLEQHRAVEAFEVLERGRARSLFELIRERDLTGTRELPRELEQDRHRLDREYDRIQAQIANLDSRRQKEELGKLVLKLREVREHSAELIARARRTAPGWAALQYPQPVSFAAAQAALGAGMLLLSYQVGEQKTYLFAVEEGRPLEVVTVPAGERELRREIELLRSLIPQAQGGGEVAKERLRKLKDLCRRLYAQLIAPVAGRAALSERLLLVPDGPLHALPWGMLLGRHGEAGGAGRGSEQYLTEWKPFSIVAAASLAVEIKRSRSALEVPGPGDLQLVAFGDPAFPARLGEGEGTARKANAREGALLERGFRFLGLPASRSEVRRIAELFPGAARIYLGAEATEERARTEGARARYLHFATHATLDEEAPLNSAVVLSIPETPNGDGENGLLQAWEIIEDLRLNADLVVLSACESGLGKELGGEGLVGLTRAFQYAGAHSVAASLWSVPDTTTGELMVRLYRHLRDGEPKDQALRHAQIELIRHQILIADKSGVDAPVDASAPYHWAGFEIFGDWQ